MPSSLAVQIVQYHQSIGRLTDIHKPKSLFRIAFIERKHKRRIMNFEELLSSCNSWQLPEGTRYNKVECWAINLDNADKYMENLSQLRSVDVLVGCLLSACISCLPGVLDFLLLGVQHVILCLTACSFDTGIPDVAISLTATSTGSIQSHQSLTHFDILH